MSALEALRLARTTWLLVRDAASTGPARSSRKPWLKGRYMRGGVMRCSRARHWPTPAFQRPWRPVCRTYNLTLRANQVLSRCSSQNSCKLVAECALCLARAHESVCGKIKGGSGGIRARDRARGRAPRAALGQSTVGSPAPLSESKHSRSPESRPFARRPLAANCCGVDRTGPDPAARGLALGKVCACVSILAKNVGYSVGRSRRLAPVGLTRFKGNIASEDTRRWFRSRPHAIPSSAPERRRGEPAGR